MSDHRFIKLDFLSQPISLSLFQVKAKQVGLPPGALIHVGQQKTEQPIISLIRYDLSSLDCQTDISLEQAAGSRQEGKVSWVNLSGIHDTAVVEAIGQTFEVHPLALEDILNTQHRPKLEEMQENTLVILKMLFFDQDSQSIRTEQVSMILGVDYVLTFQEQEGDVFDGVRGRLQRSNGRIRQRGPDYLAYALIDSIVDSYFHILEKVGDHLAQLEEVMMEGPDPSMLGRIHHYKRQLLMLHRSVWPLRDLVSELYKEESPLVAESTRVYLRDLYDHCIQVLDTVEIFRDMVSGLQDLYLSSVSNRMNEIMKVLTIMASIFIPLTFIAGIYGMNFEYIPELRWRWGYFAVWLVMIAGALGMLLFFKRKRWL
ncbi:MAG: magnesium and cobalt transport protein CorA [Desulfuromonas sp.]|nr:MAG: magnesium and cobalt transport protein CorA [Desulfuromonas sp.]